MKPAANKPTLTPKLRFPEFRGGAGWEESELRTLADPVTDRAENENENNILTLSAEQGLVLQSEYFGKKIAGTNAERYFRIQRDDFVYNDRVTKASAYGTIKRLKKHPHGIVSPIYKCFRFRDGELPGFWEWYFEAGAHDAQLRSLANEGARAGRFNVSIDRFLATSVWVPSSDSGEQQKIATCLSSLDDLIGVESRKLDTLKAHKKGLMQQLFPREGETVPRLRFPEFRKAGEWNIDLLGNVFETTSGGTPSRSVKEYWGGSIPWITTSLVNFGVITEADESITEEGMKNSSAKLLPKGTVLIAMYGQGKTRGQSALLGIEAATNQACAAILPKKEVDPYFVFLSLAERYEILRGLSNAGGQENLSQGLIRGFPFSYPPDSEEQRRVTACLSSLDGLIAAQAAKIDALSAHKKGLMQQLFPAPEVGAVGA